MILETPKEVGGVAMDPVNLGLLRQWASGGFGLTPPVVGRR